MQGLDVPTSPTRRSQPSLLDPVFRRASARLLLFPLLGLALFASPAGALDETGETQEDSSWWSTARWKYSIGLDYSRGDYGLEEDTQLIYMPASIEADFFPVRAKLTIPFLSIDGPSTVRIDGTTSTDTSSGLGQIVGSLGYLWVPTWKPLPLLEFTGKLTAPSETSDGLGNGKWAFALQTDVFKRFGPVLAFARGGRKFYTGSGLDDRFYTSLGTSVRVHDRVRLGVAYDWYEASVDSAKDTHELSPFAGIKIASRWSLGPYGLIGLSDGAPNFGAGFTLSVRH